MYHRNVRWPRQALAVLAATTIALAACGNDAEVSSPTTETPPASTETNGLAGDPILIGFHNMEGGAVSLPEFREGLEAAVQHVNGELGGVNGRPIELVVCNTDGSPEASINCANRFVEEGVVLAVQGVDAGADAALPILADAGIVETGKHAFGPQQQVDVGHSFFTGGAIQAFAVAAISTFESEGVEQATLFFNDIPSSHDFVADVIEPVAESIGIEVNAVFFPPGAADWASVVASALADDPQAVGSTGLTEPDCIGMIDALEAAGYDGIIYASQCVEFIETLGPEVSEGVFLTADLFAPTLADEVDGRAAEELATYLQAMDAAGVPEATALGFNAQGWFGLGMDIYTILSSIDGEIDAASVAGAYEVAEETRFMGGSLDCSTPAWPGETSCSRDVLVYVVQDGTVTMHSDDLLDISPFIPEG
jgi:branched-chain amino acid transport system substrate-binding protein